MHKNFQKIIQMNKCLFSVKISLRAEKRISNKETCYLCDHEWNFEVRA